MIIINPITMEIINKIEEKDTIRKIAKKTGFAYSAVYKWTKKLALLNILKLEEKGNKTFIYIEKNDIYAAFKNLIAKIEEHKKESKFWSFIKKTKLKTRLGKETSSVFWTKGGYITSDFYNKIYYLEITKENYPNLCNELKKHKINFSKNEDTEIKTRPFIIIKIIKRLKIERINNLPLTPLKELIKWCKKLRLEPILEQLKIIYKIPIKEKYAEVFTNA